MFLLLQWVGMFREGVEVVRDEVWEIALFLFSGCREEDPDENNIKAKMVLLKRQIRSCRLI